MSLLAELKRPADIRLVAVIPGRLRQDPADVCIARFGDAPALGPRAAGVFAGCEPEVLVAEIEEVSRLEPYAEQVGWLRCLRGIDTVTAMTIVAELHDFIE